MTFALPEKKTAPGVLSAKGPGLLRRSYQLPTGGDTHFVSHRADRHQKKQVIRCANSPA